MTTQPSADAPRVASPRTERQRERRRRILDAATRLASAGGFEAVQMREVAEVSGVALGTLYRYFPSKIHLLLGVLLDQLELLRETLRDRPLTETDPADRLLRTLRRAFRAHERDPRLAEAMMRALVFADRSAQAEVRAVSELTTDILVDAAGLPVDPGPERRSAMRVIQLTWHSTLMHWLSGHTTAAEADRDLGTACRLVAGGAGG
ncbi:TetR family transcriptional regulator [Streptomyces calidiresistens]|uniref:TetR family transcriptional regulator n=1 Tax=Streptomyces calidiresistens TaxID=1485586 RepID=A0A7W3T3X5_9ACTN|nr:TetR family transcriptional regulator [Streptomyces calidiresistens]MBB0230505.1 TetR family transcriptional regulator [Streptomyces calidiresistens]